jgi:hypothetical protein
MKRRGRKTLTILMKYSKIPHKSATSVSILIKVQKYEMARKRLQNNKCALVSDYFIGRELANMAENYVAWRKKLANV